MSPQRRIHRHNIRALTRAAQEGGECAFYYPVSENRYAVLVVRQDEALRLIAAYLDATIESASSSERREIAAYLRAHAPQHLRRVALSRNGAGGWIAVNGDGDPLVSAPVPSGLFDRTHWLRRSNGGPTGADADYIAGNAIRLPGNIDEELAAARDIAEPQNVEFPDIWARSTPAVRTLYLSTPLDREFMIRLAVIAELEEIASSCTTIALCDVPANNEGTHA